MLQYRSCILNVHYVQSCKKTPEYLSGNTSIIDRTYITFMLENVHSMHVIVLCGSLHISRIPANIAAEVKMTIDLWSDHMSRRLVCNHSILFQEQMMGMMTV